MMGYIAFILMLIMGIMILVTKKMPQDNYSGWLYIGNYAYPLGALIVGLALYFLYLIYKNK